MKPLRTRILIVSHTLDRGGLEQAVVTLASGLHKERFEVHVVCFVGGEAARRVASIPDVRYTEIPGRGKWSRLVALSRHIGRLRPHIVHNHYCWYGLAASLFHGVRRVETVHNTYSWFTAAERVGFMLQCLLAHRIIAVSEAVRSYTARTFPPSRRDGVMTVIHNGVVPERVQPDAPGPATHAGRQTESPAVGYVGRLEPEKGVGCLIDAMSLVRRRHPTAVLIVAGTGSLEQSLKEKSLSVGPGAVTFTGFAGDVASLYARVHVLVLPSLYEGLPLSLLEGMAAGRPVVATAVGGIPEVVREGVNGFLVPPDDPRALAEKIEQLLHDPEGRAAMGKAARETVLRHFTADRMIAETEALYAEVLEGGVRGGEGD